MVEFIGAQLGVAVEALLPYAARRQTRQEHRAARRSIYGYRAFAGRGTPPSSSIGTLPGWAKRSLGEDMPACLWSPSFCHTSRPSVGPTSCSPANTDGKNAELSLTCHFALFRNRPQMGIGNIGFTRHGQEYLTKLARDIIADDERSYSLQQSDSDP